MMSEIFKIINFETNVSLWSHTNALIVINSLRSEVIHNEPVSFLKRLSLKHFHCCFVSKLLCKSLYT